MVLGSAGETVHDVPLFFEAPSVRSVVLYFTVGHGTIQLHSSFQELRHYAKNCRYWLLNR